MSLLCAAFVVSIHMGRPDNLSPIWFLQQQFVVQGLARIAVPFFFTISGFFLAKHFGKDGWWKSEAKKRFHSLVIPFLIWSFIFAVKSILFIVATKMLEHQPFGIAVSTYLKTNYLELLGIDLTTYPKLGPLWYIRCLVLFVIVSPCISLLVSKFSYIWLILCFTMNILCEYISIPDLKEFFNIGFSVNGLFYFSIGIFIHNHPYKNSKRFAIISTFVGIILLFTKIIFARNFLPYESELVKLSIPFLLYSVWYFMPSKQLPNRLTSCSFPIFLMHLLFFPCVWVVISSLHINARYPSLQPIVNFTVGILGPIVVANILRHFAPKLAKVLFGGR